MILLVKKQSYINIQHKKVYIINILCLIDTYQLQDQLCRPRIFRSDYLEKGVEKYKFW